MTTTGSSHEVRDRCAQPPGVLLAHSTKAMLACTADVELAR